MIDFQSSGCFDSEDITVLSSVNGQCSECVSVMLWSFVCVCVCVCTHTYIYVTSLYFIYFDWVMLSGIGGS